MIGATDGTGHHAEDGFGSAGKNVGIGEEGGGENCCHTGILHSYLNGYGSLLGKGEAEEATNVIAKHIAKGVVAEHHGEHEQKQPHAVNHQLWLHLRHHSAYNQGKAGDTHSGHHLPDIVVPPVTTGIMVDKETYSYGDYCDEQYATEHSNCVNLYACVGKPPHQQGSHEGCQQGGSGCHSHGECHVATAQERHDVARHATGTASHEYDSDGEIGIKAKQLRKHVCYKRHQSELCAGSDEDVPRTAEQYAEVFRREGKTHGEHYYSENDARHVSPDPSERLGQEESQYGCGYDISR